MISHFGPPQRSDIYQCDSLIRHHFLNHITPHRRFIHALGFWMSDHLNFKLDIGAEFVLYSPNLHCAIESLRLKGARPMVGAIALKVDRKGSKIGLGRYWSLDFDCAASGFQGTIW